MTFTLDVTDDLAGVDLSSTRVLVASPDGQPRDEAQLSMTSGSHRTAPSRATVTVPRFAPQGTWTGELVAHRPGGQPDHVVVGRADRRPAFPGGFDQTGPGDADAPVLTGFSLSPSAINTTGSPQADDVRLHGDDDVAGIDLAESKVVATSPAGLPLESSAIQQVSGDGYGRRLPSDDHRPARARPRAPGT